MYKKLLQFIKYNNAFTIIIFVCFFSFGVSFASPVMRDSIYASVQTVISVDNGLIISADLDNFNFNLRINSITEDEKNYYVSYSYQTLVIEDSIWQNKQIEKILTVSKEALAGKDLGLYVTKELGDNINYELSYLRRVQKLEKDKGESQKVVTVEYSGLIGKLLDPKEMVIDGYEPVVPEIVPVIPTPEEDIIIIPEPVIVPVEPITEEVITPEAHPEIIIDATSTPETTPESVIESASTSATSTPENNPEPEIDATSTPEITPESVIESASTSATSTPENNPEPEIDATSTPETTPEPEIEVTPVPEVVLEPTI